MVVLWLENNINLKDFIPMIVCINFTTFLFIIGLVGIIINKNNFIILLVCFELIFFSIILQFIFFSIYFSNVLGQIYALCIITMVGSETALGLSLLIIAFRISKQVNYNVLTNLRG